ncbi:MAG TPA: SHOCT domain-containing protein [Dehalococcoidia bacterium]|nr:SHOCT domain-containing protein [Dehalococcoidia bacterium]
MWTMHDGMAWWMVFGWLWFALFWGGIIWLFVWAVQRLTNHKEQSRPSPLDIARERLARGEISEEDFRRLKEHLT